MKKTFQILRNILLLLLAVLFLFIVIHQIITLVEKKKYPAIGKVVTVDQKQMSLYIAGKGKHTIVLLPGLGTTSPILDFMPLVDTLAKDNRVVVVEFFGYGWSDITPKERTIENEVEELRSALKAADIEGPYILMPHSLSGLHSIYYANTYPDEVAGIIGIDCALPTMTDYFDDEELPEPISLVNSQLVNLGVMRLINFIAPDNFTSDNSSHYYTEENLTIQRCIASRNASNKNVIDQSNHIADSIKKTHKMKFRKDLPLLFFAPDESNLTPRDDGKTKTSFYETYIANPSLQKVITLNGPHYLHWTCKDEIATAVKDYLRNVRY